MGFLKKALSVVSAPVTAPLKVASNIADNLGIGGPVAAVSNLASAPFELLQKGTDFGTVMQQAKPGLQLLASAAGGPLGGALGMDTGVLAKFLPGDSSPTPLREDYSYSGGISTTPVYQPPQSPNLTPYILGGGLLVIGLVVALKRS